MQRKGQDYGLVIPDTPVPHASKDVSHEVEQMAVAHHGWGMLFQAPKRRTATSALLLSWIDESFPLPLLLGLAAGMVDSVWSVPPSCEVEGGRRGFRGMRVWG